MPHGELGLFLVGPASGQAEVMNARFLPSSADKAGDAAATGPVSGPVTGPAEQACCCVAKAMVRVVIPPAPSRAHETELLLCGHHYRVSRQALAAAHAHVDELPEPAGQATLYHGERPRSAYAVAVAR